jgi:hypothetical protein
MTVRGWFIARTGRTVWCWMFGHPDPLHEVTTHGACWVCPACRRWYHSGLA